MKTKLKSKSKSKLITYFINSRLVYVIILVSSYSNAQIDCENLLAFGVSQKKLSDFSVESIREDDGIQLTFRNKPIAFIEKSNQKFLIKELFKDKFLFISFYSNFGAAGTGDNGA